MFKYLKNALFNGLIILIPLVLLYITLRELLELLIVVATPIADLFPEDAFKWAQDPEIVAGLLVVVTALLLGILATIPAVRAAGRYLESNTVGHLPIYRMIKTLVLAFLEVEGADAFRPALVRGDDGSAEPAYIIEDGGLADIVVMLPWTPASFAGSVRLVPRSRVQRLDVTLDEFSMTLSNFGLGLQTLVPASRSTRGDSES